MSEPEKTREENIQLCLKRGMTRESAESFLASKEIVWKKLVAPGEYSPEQTAEFLATVRSYGIIKSFSLVVAFPNERMELITKALEAVAAKGGGFLTDTPLPKDAVERMH